MVIANSSLFTNGYEISDSPFMPSDISIFSGLVNSVEMLSNCTCVGYNLEKDKVIYKSENLLFAKYALSKDKQRNCENPYWALLPTRFLPKIEQLKRTVLSTFQVLYQKNFRKYYSTTDFPVIIRGQELYVNQTFTPLVVSSDGRTRMGLLIYSSSICREMESSIIVAQAKGMSYDFVGAEYKKFDYTRLLTESEKLVLQMSMNGLTNKRIASLLNKSEATIVSHKKHLFEKLNVKNLQQAIIFANKYHLI